MTITLIVMGFIICRQRALIRNHLSRTSFSIQQASSKVELKSGFRTTFTEYCAFVNPLEVKSGFGSTTKIMAVTRNRVHSVSVALRSKQESGDPDNSSSDITPSKTPLNSLAKVVSPLPESSMFTVKEVVAPRKSPRKRATTNLSETPKSTKSSRKTKRLLKKDIENVEAAEARSNSVESTTKRPLPDFSAFEYDATAETSINTDPKADIETTIIKGEATQELKTPSPTKKKQRSSSTSSKTNKREKILPGSLTPPNGWKETYELVEELRADKTAPVDYDGAASLPETHLGPKVYRFQVLVSLLLSSQTKDAICGEAVKNLQKVSDGGFH